MISRARHSRNGAVWHSGTMNSSASPRVSDSRFCSTTRICSTGRAFRTPTPRGRTTISAGWVHALTVDADGDGIPEQWGLSFDVHYTGLETVIYSFGGRMLTDDSRRADLSGPATLRAFRYIQEPLRRPEDRIQHHLVRESLGFVCRTTGGHDPDRFARCD